MLTVDKGDQTITFNALPAKSIEDADFNPGASSSSALSISYSSNNTSVATIIGSMIHIIGEGSAIITASQAGDANYNAAIDVSQTLIVNLTTGFKDPVISQTRFNIYPSFSHINIETLVDEWDGKTGNVTIFNILGKIITTLTKTEFRKGSLVQVEAPSVRGIYIVELKSEDMRYVSKVMIR